MEVLTNNHYEKILDLFDGATKSIKIISPFISESIAKKLCDAVGESSIKCEFITRFYLEDMFARANSMDAIEMMMDAGIEVYALKGLHTKLYLFDENYGVLGSANFTAGGFKSNIELSLLMGQKDNILTELHSYFDELLSKIKQSDNYEN
jgi:phosphatidylserine/phosphatidylglycerophosphate/cardiolipin synthase-like enzyme